MIISEYHNLLVYKKGYTIVDIQSLIKRHDLNGLEIRSLLSDEDFGDLSFLKGATFLRSFRIVSRFNYDLSFVAYLNNLNRLSLNVEGFKKTEIFENLPLKDLSLSMRREKFDIRVPRSLDVLYLQEVAASSLGFILNPKNVKSLQVKSSKIGSLEGIQKFLTLQSLTLGGVSGLKTIDQKLPLTLAKITLNQLPSLTLVNIPPELGNCEIIIEHCKKLNLVLPRFDGRKGVSA